jgi:hypothetical protein
MERRQQGSAGYLYEGRMALVSGLMRPKCALAGVSRSRRMSRERCITMRSILIALLVLSAAPMANPAELSRSREYEIKSAFLFNFIKFTDWPDEGASKSHEPFVIGVLGKDPFGAVLDKIIEGETIENQNIAVRRFARMDERAGHSQVLFISSSEESQLTAILKLLEGQPVLTVSDMENFARRGGIIQLTKEGNKVGFEINLDTAKRAGLKLNAQLLKLAKIVKK